MGLLFQGGLELCYHGFVRIQNYGRIVGGFFLCCGCPYRGGPCCLGSVAGPLIVGKFPTKVSKDLAEAPKLCAEFGSKIYQDHPLVVPEYAITKYLEVHSTYNLLLSVLADQS